MHIICHNFSLFLVGAYPYSVVCQLESSGKWPDKVEAIGKIKTAFYIYIGKALTEHYGLITSPTADFLDILKVYVSELTL